MKVPAFLNTVVAGALSVAAVGCISAPPLEDPAEVRVARPQQAASTSAAQQAPSPYNAAPVLYARDGTPVSAAGPTVVQEPTGPLATRDLAGSQGGRMYILELYQNVIEERDTLSMEVTALDEELARARQALASADQRIAELEGNLRTAADENQRLREENVDLAGRLTTAQIRRLQTEKILLELRLAEIEATPGAARAAGAERTQRP